MPTRSGMCSPLCQAKKSSRASGRTSCQMVMAPRPASPPVMRVPELFLPTLPFVLLTGLQVIVPHLAHVLVAVGFLLPEELLVGRVARFLDELGVLGRRVVELDAFCFPLLADRAFVVHQRLRVANAVLAA